MPLQFYQQGILTPGLYNVAQFVAMMWKKADGINPTGGLNPNDYGWHIVDDILEPDWYAGNSAPNSLSNDDDESDETPINIMNQDDEYSSEWSE